MELRQLQYFTAVAETLNFSRAAEILYISQPALSQQIADLERELGVLLLQRSKRAVSLTPAGALLLQEAKKLLYQSEKLAPLIRSQEQAHSSDQELVLGVDKCVDLSNSHATFPSVPKPADRVGVRSAPADFQPAAHFPGM